MASAKSSDSGNASPSTSTGIAASSISLLPLRYRVNSSGELQDTDGGWVPANLYRQLLLLLFDAETPIAAGSPMKLHPNYKARVLTALLKRITELASPSLDASSPALKGLIDGASDRSATLESARRSGLRRCIRVMREVQSVGVGASLPQLEQNGNQLDDKSMFDALQATQEPDAASIAAAERQAEAADAWKLEKSDTPDNEEEVDDALSQIQTVNAIRTAFGHQPVAGPN